MLGEYRAWRARQLKRKMRKERKQLRKRRRAEEQQRVDLLKRQAEAQLQLLRNQKRRARAERASLPPPPPEPRQSLFSALWKGLSSVRLQRTGSGLKVVLLLLILQLLALHAQAGGSPPHEPPEEGYGSRNGAATTVARLHEWFPTPGTTTVTVSNHAAISGRGLLPRPQGRETPPGVAPARVAVPTIPASSVTPEGKRHPGDDSSFVKDQRFGYTWCERPDLPPEMRTRFRELLQENDDVFARSLKELGCYCGELGPATIELVHDRPIWQAPRRHSPRELTIQEEKCCELRDAGIIIPSISMKYAMNSTMPAKKDAEGNWTDSRYCCDARPLNAATVPDKYAPPLPEELFARVGNARWLSKCDCRAAFNQIPLREGDREKTSFWWKGALWQYCRNLYGLKNATAHFQRIMDHHIRKSGLQHCAMAFVDDILVYSQTAEEHAEHLARVFEMLRSIGLKLHPDKTVLAAHTVEFLGHMVSADGLRPMDAKIAAIQALTQPTNRTELLSILGLMNYYRCYLPKFSEIAAPLNALTRKGVIWDDNVWGPEQQRCA